MTQQTLQYVLLVEQVVEVRTTSSAGGGGGGQGRVGKFSVPDGGRTLTINVGGRGGNGSVVLMLQVDLVDHHL